MRQKSSANWLKKFRVFEHIKLLFSMFRKIFNNPLMGFKAGFHEFKNEKRV